MAFSSLAEFHNYFFNIENELDKILSNSDGFLEMTVHGPSQPMGFNSKIYRMTIDEFKGCTLDVLGSKSTMFLLCAPCSKYLEMNNNLTALNEKLNLNYNSLSERVLCIFTKPDLIEKTQSYQMIIEHQQTWPNVKFCFLRCRSNDERTAYPNMKDFYVAETDYYKAKKLFRCYTKCYFGTEFVINSISFCVLKNIASPEQMNQYQTYLRLILEELETKIQENKSTKANVLRNLKVVLKYSVNLCQFNQNLLVNFIQTMFNVITITMKNSHISTYITVELNKLLSRPLPINPPESVKNLNKTMLTENDMVSFIFQEFSLHQIEMDMISLKRLFRSYFDMNNDDIKKKIALQFPRMPDDFIITVYSVFDKISKDAYKKANNLVNAFDEIERTFNICSYYFRNPSRYEKYSTRFNEIPMKLNLSQDVSSNIQGEKLYALCNDIITSLWKEKIKLIIENYVKIFHSIYYNSMIISFNECLVENIYNEHNLASFKEREEIIQKNNELIKAYEIVNQIYLKYRDIMLLACPKDSIDKLPLSSISKLPPEDEDLAKYEPVIYEDNFKIAQNAVATDLEISREKEEPGSCEQSFSFTMTNESDGIIMIWDSTNEISVFNITENKIILKEVPDLPQNKFLDDNRYINFHDSVFIIGGRDANQEPLNLCLELKKRGTEYEVIPMTNFPDESYPYRHSLIIAPNIPAIILVGCLNSKKSFLYSLNDKQWQDFGNLKNGREDCTLALANNKIVFCIGGLINCNDEDLSLKTFIEYKYINLKDDWNICNIKYDSSLVPQIGRIYGCGVLPYKSSLLILGGLFQYPKLEENENNLACFEMEVLSVKDNSCDVSLASININNSAKIKSWFVESNFTRNIFEKHCLFNFNVDGEIVKFNETAKDIEIEEYTFI